MTAQNTVPEAEAEAAPAVTDDRLLDGRVRLRQPAQGYRVAIDPVLLAAATPATAGQKVLDLGCGVGAAALALLARVPELEVVGLELQAPLAKLARENARLNGADGRFLVLTGDLLRLPPRLAPGAFDQVLCNPPQQAAERARAPAERSRAIAEREGEARLADWVRVALLLLRDGGTLTLVHRADRLDALLAALSAGRAGEIVVFPLWPGPGKSAKRILVRARKGVETPLRLAPGLVLHGPDGRFTPQAEAVLRDGEALVP